MIYVRTGFGFLENGNRLPRSWRQKQVGELNWRIMKAILWHGSEKNWIIASKSVRFRDKVSVRKEMEQFGAPLWAIEAIQGEEVLVEDTSTIATDGSSG